ncbi:hypothetical protein D3C87_1436510 [compost metagenome]
MNIFIANIADVDALWQTVGPRFNSIMERSGDDLSAGELWQMCRSGNAFLIIAADESGVHMAVVVRFERWTKGLVLRVISLVGQKVQEWATLAEEFVIDMAKSNGATSVVTDGRDGWPAVFTGLKKLHSTFLLEI